MSERWTAEQIAKAVEAVGADLRETLAEARKRKVEMVKSMTRDEIGWPEDLVITGDWAGGEW